MRLLRSLRRGLLVGVSLAALTLQPAAAQLLLTGAGAYPQAAVAGGGFTAYTGQVATRSFLPNDTDSATQTMVRTRMVLTDAVSSFKVVFANWVGAVASFLVTDTDITGTTTYETCVETAGGTNLGHILWSGSNTIAAASGATVVSDTFSLGSTFTAGTAVFLRTYVTKTGGGMPRTSPSAGGMFDAANGEVAEFGTSVTNTCTGTGTWTGNTTAKSIYPAAVLGTTTKPTFAIYGDSRQQGVGDTPNANGDAGEAARWIGAGGYGYVNMGIGGDSASGWVKRAPYRRYLERLVAPTHVVVGFGINDTRAGGLNLTAAETEAWTKNIWDALGANRPLTQFTLAPQTTDAVDSWATTTLQTVDANNAQTIAFNQFMRTPPAALGAVVDAGNGMSSATDSGKWFVDGTANKCTTDGLHGTPYCYNLVQVLTPTASTVGALRSTSWTPFELMPLVSAGILYGVWVDQGEYYSRTVGLTNGNSVSSWKSRSSGGTFDQTSTARPTVNTNAFATGVDGFTFASASSQTMPGSGASTLQGALNSRPAALMWAVVKPGTATGAQQTILENRGGGGLIRTAVGITTSGGVLKPITVTRRLDGDGSTTNTGATTLSVSSNYIILWYLSPTNNTVTVRVNGTVDSSINGVAGFSASGNWDSTSSTVTIGGSSSAASLFNGTLGEVGMAPTATSFGTTEFNLLECYLSAKYSISIGHGC